MKRKGFTLLELLIVIAILAVLATVAVLVINPLEYLKQSRDAKRLGDIETLNKALNLADFEGISLGGTSTTVFVSLVDTVATCANLGLPSLPTGYQYHCVTAAASLNKVDGTGWIPVDLNNLSSKSPIATLPVDPTNNATDFYTYIPGGSFALSATLESDKYLKQAAPADGGTNPGKIEMGSDLSLLAKADGLVGYWPLDEGSGTQVLDASGNGYTGTGATIGWTSSGCVSGKCVTAATGNSAISLPFAAGTPIDLRTRFTMMNWVKINTAIPTSTWPVSLGLSNTHLGYGFRSTSNGTNWMFEYGNDAPTCGGALFGSSAFLNLGTGTWHFLSVTYDGAAIKVYLDGILKTNTAFSKGFCYTSPLIIGGIGTAPGSYVVDEPRVYGRALSASEIQAMYTAAK